MREKKSYIAIGQYQKIFLWNTSAPRKDLLKMLYRKHADRIYNDSKDGPVHIGYVIAREWFTLYELKRMENKV